MRYFIKKMELTQQDGCKIEDNFFHFRLSKECCSYTWTDVLRKGLIESNPVSLCLTIVNEEKEVGYINMRIYLVADKLYINDLPHMGYYKKHLTELKGIKFDKFGFEFFVTDSISRGIIKHITRVEQSKFRHIHSVIDLGEHYFCNFVNQFAYNIGYLGRDYTKYVANSLACILLANYDTNGIMEQYKKTHEICMKCKDGYVTYCFDTDYDLEVVLLKQFMLNGGKKVQMPTFSWNI